MRERSVSILEALESQYVVEKRSTDFNDFTDQLSR